MWVQYAAMGCSTKAGELVLVLLLLLLLLHAAVSGFAPSGLVAFFVVLLFCAL